MTKAIWDLCTRWGKTRTVLETFKNSDSRFLLMCSYIGTVRTSYREEISKQRSYLNIKFFDPDDWKSEENLITNIQNHLNADEKNKVFYYVALTGDDKDIDFDSEESVEIDEGCFQRRTNLLKNFKGFSSDVVVEEVDFGASCEKQIKKLIKLATTMNCEDFICTTGTNAEKALQIFKACDDDEIIYMKRDYILDVLNNREKFLKPGTPKPVKIKWNVLDNAGMVALGFDPARMENFTDMFEIEEDGTLRGQIYFENLFRYLYKHYLKNDKENQDRNEILLDGTKNLTDEEAATMIFTPIGYSIHEALKKIIENVFGENNVIVKIIDGSKISNAKAEKYAKDAIRCANGKKVFFIASGMANRSFSVKQIKNIILLINDGSYSSIAQKIARAFTPWNDDHRTAYIIDFRFNYANDCLTKYLSRLGVDSISDNCLNKTTEEVEKVIETLIASRKLQFNRYFINGINPIRELSMDEISLMLRSADFRRKQCYSCISEVCTDAVTEPIRCPENEKDSTSKLANTNIKGDQKKVIIPGKKLPKNLTEEQKKEIEIENKKIAHMNFILNNFAAIDRGIYKTNVLEQEVKAINNNPVRKATLERMYNVDMRTITDISKIFSKHKINIDDFSKLSA